MAKSFDDVIVPERRRSIRNIPIPEGRRKNNGMARVDAVKKHSAEPAETAYAIPPARLNIPRGRRESRRDTWIALGIAALILVFAILSIFDGATLAYVPRSTELAFDNETYKAYKTGATDLIYSVVKLSGEKGIEVPASGEEEVSHKASGVIIVYNDASTESQRLIENTRFKSPGGKIYRIQNAIVIPGKKTVAGTTQPGSVEATIYADAPGAEYNSELTDFTVPGLKGTARYSTIYARSKTPLAGGFIGKEKIVSKEDLDKAKSSLKSALSEELLAKASAEVPSDFILFPALSSVTFEVLPQSSASGNKAMVNVKGSLYGIMFKRSDLARELASKKVTLSPEELVSIKSFNGLEITFAGTPPADLLPLNEISFKVKGSATLLWSIDEVALKTDLLGRHKREIPNILRNYPTVASASATVRPFWKKTLPTDTGKLLIKELNVE